MKRTLALCALLLAAGAGTAAVQAAPARMTMHVPLHVTARYMHNMHFAHAMASATVRYSGGDAFIKVSADNLPAASTLGKRAFVVYASDGGMTDRVGVLTAHGSMAGVSGEVMMTKVQDLYVYAESSAANKHPHGIKVMSAMVG